MMDDTEAKQRRHWRPHQRNLSRLRGKLAWPDLSIKGISPVRRALGTEPAPEKPPEVGRRPE